MNITITGIAPLIAILFAHWIADFVLQSRYMGNNKSSDVIVMFSHISAYMGAMFVVLMFMTATTVSDTTVVVCLAYVILNGTAHFITDMVTSRITKLLWAAKQEHWFWCVIGLDQFLHITVLILTLPILALP